MPSLVENITDRNTETALKGCSRARIVKFENDRRHEVDVPDVIEVDCVAVRKFSF